MMRLADEKMVAIDNGFTIPDTRILRWPENPAKIRPRFRAKIEYSNLKGGEFFPIRPDILEMLRDVAKNRKEEFFNILSSRGISKAATEDAWRRLEWLAEKGRITGKNLNFGRGFGEAGLGEAG